MSTRRSFDSIAFDENTPPVGSIENRSNTNGKSLGIRAHRSSASISSSMSTGTIKPTQALGDEDFSNIDSDYYPDSTEKSVHVEDGTKHYNSPRAPLADTSVSINMTPSSAGVASELSTPAELSLGPQSLPFMLRRREEVNQGTPSRATHSSGLHRMTTERSLNAKQSGPSSIQVPVALDTHSKAADNVKHYEKKLSSWRCDQIKKAKQPELSPDSVPKPISTLYGPLSLPYARNPSGVDATVADETAYLSQVFGLCPASGGASSTVGTDSFRTVSTGTQSSSHSFRSTSGPSLDFGLVPEGLGGTYQARPLFVKDLYQNVLIQKEKPGMGFKRSTETIPFQFETLPLHPPPSELDEAEVGNNSFLKHNHVLLPNQDDRRVVSDTILLEPKLGTSVLGPSKSYANLREITKLSPIPGSPINSHRMSNITTVRDAYKYRMRSASTSRVDPRLHAQAQSEGYNASYATPPRIPALLPVYYNPTSMTYEISVRPDRDVSSSQDQVSSTEPTMERSTHARSGSGQYSKADISDNWRMKSRMAEQAKHMSTTTSVRPKTLYTPIRPQPQTPNTTGHFHGHDGGVATTEKIMTIDKLFEKFSPQTKAAERAQPQVSFKFPNAETHILEPPHSPQESMGTPATPTEALVDVSDRTAKDLSSKTLSDPANVARLASAASILAKGTPGAGNLLKKPVKKD